MKNIKDDISDERMHMWISLNVNIWSNLRGNVIISIGHNIGNNIYAFQAPSPIDEITIYAITGRKMITFIPHTNQTEINLSSLPDGFYICYVQTEHEKKVYKIVK